MTTRVVNLRKEPYTLYIGRPGKGFASIRELCMLAAVDGYGDEACQIAKNTFWSVRKWMKEKEREASK